MVVGTFIAIGTCYLNFFYRVVHSISLSASLVMTCFISELYKYVFFLPVFFFFVSLTSSLSTLPFQRNSSLISFFSLFFFFKFYWFLVSLLISSFLNFDAFQICYLIFVSLSPFLTSYLFCPLLDGCFFLNPFLFTNLEKIFYISIL